MEYRVKLKTRCGCTRVLSGQLNPGKSFLREPIMIALRESSRLGSGCLDGSVAELSQAECRLFLYRGEREVMEGYMFFVFEEVE